MTLINVRELLAFPPGANSSDTEIIQGIHWNLTTLNHWNYTYYSNGTLSNGSSCYLLFAPYTPHLLENGTFLNSSSCYSPINPIGPRAKAGIGFGIFFAISVMFTFINLRKHGKLFLPPEKRFRAVGRRWQWYWMLVVAAFAIISCITGVDIDRYYLPELPMILANFFWFLMLPCTLAVVWESVRHWGSWQERQVVDPNPFFLRQDDRRSRIELWLPLVFYFFIWMNFFMIVPRSWSSISDQRDLEQARLIAEPVATDVRFKIAAFLNFGGWFTIVYSLGHSLKHYKPQNRGMFNGMIGFIKSTPNKFLLTIPLSLVLVGYEAACAFDFAVSPLRYHDPNLGMMYGLGWGSIAAVFLIYEIAGYLDPNEDRELIRQRRIRGTEIDQEIGIVQKPRWWSRLRVENRAMNVGDQITQNVVEIGGGRATTKNLERSIEMGNMPVSKRHEGDNVVGDRDAIRTAANLLFPTRIMDETQERFTDHPETERGRKETRTSVREPMGGRSGSNDSTASGAILGA